MASGSDRETSEIAVQSSTVRFRNSLETGNPKLFGPVFDQKLIELNAKVGMESRNPINIRRNFRHLTDTSPDC